MYEGLQTIMQTFMQEHTYTQHTYTPADWWLIPVSMGYLRAGNAIRWPPHVMWTCPRTWEVLSAAISCSCLITPDARLRTFIDHGWRVRVSAPFSFQDQWRNRTGGILQSGLSMATFSAPMLGRSTTGFGTRPPVGQTGHLIGPVPKSDKRKTHSPIGIKRSPSLRPLSISSFRVL